MKQMKAKFDGRCKVCGAGVIVGDEIVWFGPRKGVAHIRCHGAVAKVAPARRMVRRARRVNPRDAVVRAAFVKMEAAKKAHMERMERMDKMDAADRCPKCKSRTVMVGEMDGFDIHECTNSHCNNWVEVPSAKKI